MALLWAKRLALAAVVIGVVLGFYQAMRTKPVAVDAGKVSRGEMTVSILQEGETRVRNVYGISSPIAGHLARTIIEKGDPVEAGKTVIAAIHPLEPPLIDSRTMAELEAARQAAAAGLAIAQVELEQARTNLGLAEKSLDRASRLAPSGVISESALEKAAGDVDLQRAIVNAAEAAIRLRKAELAAAEARLEQPASAAVDTKAGCCINLTAPVNGVVLDVFAKSEQPVGVGTKIAEIGDPRDLEIVIDLLSADAVRIRPGTTARIVNWGGEEALDAVVRRVEPTGYTKVSALGIEEQRVDAVLDLKTPEPRLGHGFRVFAEVAVWKAPDVLQVPLPALFRTGNDWSVFVIQGDRIAQKRVTVGQMNDRAAEVIDGLSEGDAVVLHPGDTLGDGTLVDVRAP
mgnify:CR=1 FL=1|jgi:HlyD family secretion protein